MIQRLKDNTDQSVAQTLKQERAERVAKNGRLRELRVERGAATKAAKPPLDKPAALHRPKRKKPVPD